MDSRLGKLSVLKFIFNWQCYQICGVGIYTEVNVKTLKNFYFYLFTFIEVLLTYNILVSNVQYNDLMLVYFVKLSPQ